MRSKTLLRQLRPGARGSDGIGLGAVESSQFTFKDPKDEHIIKDAVDFVPPGSRIGSLISWY